METLNDEDQKSKIDDAYDKGSYSPSGLSDAENDAFNDITSNYGDNADDSAENDNIAKARDGENNPAVNPMNYVKDAKNPVKALDNAKIVASSLVKGKKAPIGAIIGLLLGLAGVVSFFGAPSMLIVNIAEVMTDKYNLQLGSMNTRTNRIFNSKMNSTTAGFCAGAMNVRCKYSSFSDKQVQRMIDAGITIPDGERGNSLAGRTKPSKLIIDGVEIDAKDFQAASLTNPKLNAALKRVYNPKVVGMLDNKLNTILGRNKTSKAAPFPDEATDEERSQALIDTVNEGADGTRAATVEVGDTNEACAAECTEAEVDQINEAADSTNRIASEAETNAANGIKSAQPNLLSKLNGAVGVAGLADDLCTIPNMANAIATGAKVIRSAQLARYAMIFLTTASMIKAGTAESGDVAYLGTIITTVLKTTNADGTVTTGKSGTDSFGYRSAAFGDKGTTDSMAPFMLGGGLTGAMSGLVSTIYSFIPGGKSTCRVAGNTAVQGVSLVAGIAMSFIPVGGQVAQASKVAATAAIKKAITSAIGNIVKGFAEGLAIGYVVNYLTALGQDMLSGQAVDPNTTVGEASVDAMSGGTGEILTQTAGLGGNAVLTPEQAVGYQNVMNSTNNEYAALDRATLSPFDVSSPNTAFGAIYTKLAPYLSQSQSFTGTISSIFGMVSSSFSNIVSSDKVKAYTAEDYETCEDDAYREAGVATDEFCHVIRGIPAEYLGSTSLEIIDRIESDIDMTTGEPSSDAYKTYVTKCMINLEVSGACIIDNQQKADWSVHYIDQRINETMDNGYSESNGGAASTSTATDSTLGVGTGEFTDSGEAVNGWDNVLANAQASEAMYGDTMSGDGRCAAITSRVWHGNNTSYGYAWAIHLWNTNEVAHGHTDRAPKKGALLLYQGSSVYGHVAIYLGNNKILNDGHIVDASYPETAWGQDYLGWIDPTELGWVSVNGVDYMSNLKSDAGL